MYDGQEGVEQHFPAAGGTKLHTGGSFHDKQLKEINRIYYQSPMQIEQSRPEGKRIMPETRFTELPALSFDPKVGISRSASETNA